MGTLKLNKKTTSKEYLQQNAQSLKGECANKKITKSNLINRLSHGDDGFVKEVTDKREANSFVYKRNNRTLRKIISATPILYKTSANQFKEINNELSENGNEIVNTDNSYKVKFNKNAGDNTIFELCKDNKTLILQSMKKDGARVKSCGCKCERDATMNNAVNMTLDDVTNIQYIALNDRIKENIIISEKKDIYEYFFKLNIGDMEVEKSEHNSLLIKDASTGDVKFIIPAPFMYDANNARSNDVSYEIEAESGELQFKVIASAEFVNAAERAFPVTIDPQVIIPSHDNGIQFITTKWADGEDDTIIEGILETFFSMNAKDGSYCEIIIDKDLIDYTNSDIVNIKLILKPTGYIAGYLKINDVLYEAKNEDYEIDLKDLLINTVGDQITIKMSADIRDKAIKTSSIEFETTGENAPKIVIDYIPFKKEEPLPVLKGIGFTDRTTGYFNAGSGELATAVSVFRSSDFLLPLDISFVHRCGFGKTACGLNWHLNLDKKLKISKADTSYNTHYVYTDELGDNYLISEYYYYLDGNERVFINNKSEIVVDINGNLTYNGHTVYTCQSVNDLTLITEKTDFVNVELLDQKQSELVELEDYINTYSVTLAHYVKLNTATNKIVERIGMLTKDNFEDVIEAVNSDSNIVVMTESEALQVISLFNQKIQLELQREQLSLQNTDYGLQYKQLGLQELQLNQQAIDYQNTINSGKEASERESAAVYYEIIEGETSYECNQIEVVQQQQASANSQKTIITNQIPTVNKQLEIVNDQINYIIAQAKEMLPKIRDIIIQYSKKLAQHDLLVQQLPVNYLKDSSGNYCGFNEAGDLVYISDANGNACMINWNENHNIDYIYNDTETLVSFIYNDGFLQSITDNRGRTVKFSYETNDVQVTKLVGITFADGEKLDLMYSDNHMHNLRTDSLNSQVKIYHDENGVYNSIVYLAKPGTISKDTEFTSSGYKEQKKITILKNASSMSFTDNEDNSESYFFNEDGSLQKHTTKDNTNSEETTTYTYNYTASGKTITETTTSNKENKTSTVIKQYNNIGQLISLTEDWQPVSDSVSIKTVTLYSYDLNGKVISETATKSIGNGGTTDDVVCVTEYNYNNEGLLILTKSYIQGEEQISGISYEERVYNENGFCTKTISWNSLDSSSKFYSESDVSESGQVMADRDETGAVSAEYDYVNKTNVVNSVKYANGSKLAYGINPHNYNITSVTQSTSEGEENTSDRIYAYGLPVTVKSGNTVIDYCYDQKGRKTKVDINGVTQANYSYEDYSYDKSSGYAVYGKQTTTINIAENTHIAVVSDKTGTLDADSGLMMVYESIKVDNAQLTKKSYDVKGRLKTVEDSVSGTSTYSYDDYDNLTSVVNVNNSETVLSENYIYNVNSELTQKTISAKLSQTYSYSYFYKDNAARSLDYISIPVVIEREKADGNTEEVTVVYKFCPLTDVNGRNTGREIIGDTTKIATEYITYRKVGDHATNMPATVWFGNGNTIKDSIKYKYDSCGNICEITQNGHLFARYKYDSLNRLIREDNKGLNKTLIYTYDANGNIVERCEYAYTNKATDELSDLECTHYSYDYDGDKLVSYNGTTIAYNSLGNPTTYRGNAITWQYGKRLTGYGSTTFTYDGQGRRISKNNITFTYDSNGNLLKQSNGLEFIYDNSGVIGVKYSGGVYFYRRDAQGNIAAILDSNGNVLVKYIYDGWGNHAIVAENGEDIESGIGVLNPFRYRGYYYDTETELYFLQTRYYDPEVGRFISRDSIEYADPETINGLNLYAYCGNNPIMNVDPTGNAWWNWLLSIGQIIVGGLLVVTGVGAGFGAALVAGGAIGLVSNAIGSSIGGGLGSMLNGWGAISTGISLLSFGLPGIVIGAGLMVIGGATMVMGANEVVSGITGTNYMRNLMGAEVYDGLYIGLNIASSIGTIAGRLGMRHVGTTYTNRAEMTYKPYGKIITNKNIYYYNGKGKPYWSIHNYNAIIDGTRNGFHWHNSLGRDKNHIYSYIKFLLKFIFTKW